MFICSFKMTYKKILGVVCIAFALILSIVFFTNLRNQPETTGAKSDINYSAEDEKTIKDFIGTFGYQIEDKPVEIIEISVPETYDTVFERYEKLQEKQGFSLDAFKGKTVKRWSYEITNYPDHPKDVLANVMVSDGKIIGGDVCSRKLDGFMHGFNRPETAGTNEY